MSETLEYIDDYFTGALPGAERAVFESRISADEAFAQEVAFYLNARQAVKQELLLQKEAEWAASIPAQEIHNAPVVPLKQRVKTKIRRVIAIAASIAVTVGTSLTVIINSANNLQRAAKNYVEELPVSGTLDGSRDSLQLGIEAYEADKFNDAEKYFTAVYAAYPQQSDALKYNGLVSLRQKEYEEALNRFKELAGKNLRYNPGLFYQAVTLMMRDNEGDNEQAGQLLHQVADGKMAGYEKAREWLNKFFKP